MQYPTPRTGCNFTPKPGRKVIVEIGHGSSPVWSVFKRLPLEDQSYIGLDLSRSGWPPGHMPLYDLDAGRKKIEDRAAGGRDCSYICLDGSGVLPLPDGIASEVYAARLFNDPRIGNRVIETLMHEVARVSGQGGRFVINNGSPGLVDMGDVFVDWSRHAIIYKATAGRGSDDEDRFCWISMFLNSMFSPLDEALYPRFLAERGVASYFLENECSRQFSILVRR